MRYARVCASAFKIFFLFHEKKDSDWFIFVRLVSYALCIAHGAYKNVKVEAQIIA